MERLRRKKEFTESEKEEIIEKMVRGYKKMAAVNNDSTGNFSLLKDGTN